MDCIVRGKRKSFPSTEEILGGLQSAITADLTRAAGATAARVRSTVEALSRLGDRLKTDAGFLGKELAELGLTQSEAHAAREGAAEILHRDALHRKIRRELGGLPLEITRPRARESALEGWLPVGVLGHVTSANDPMLPFLSAVEGLITGNINLVKTARGAGAVAMELAEALCAIDPSLCPYIHVYPISSQDEATLSALFSLCDAIAVWGSDAAVAGVRKLTPPGTPVIAWGHRISFAYVSAAGRSAAALEGIARDVCANEQQACSAPQLVYYETEDRDELLAFAREMHAALSATSPQYPLHDIADAEQAEITTQLELAHCAETLGDMAVLASPDFRVLVGFDREPEPSPLYRTLRVKALPRGAIIETFRPYRAYLQSVGLAATAGEVAELSPLFFRAGATRIVPPGHMLDGYVGEPHDGVYALGRYVRRVSLDGAGLPAGLMDLNEMSSLAEPPFPPGTPIMAKERFSPGDAHEREGGIVLKSGGSSGKAVYAPHSRGDAEMTYVTAGRAIMAAGFDPSRDRCMNLFFAGSLYGGFISLYEGLKSIDALQFPMAAETDLAAVAEAIIACRVNTLIGMPSYLVRLFAEQRGKLASYRGVEKVLYGGEHFDPAQVRLLERDFGVKRVASLVYGCNELGSIGYACPHCRKGEHHLFGSKYLEILKLDRDEPAAAGEVGRLVISPMDRENSSVARFEIGDLGRYVPEPCPCGRKAAKFELLGRFGDIFRFATNYVNYGVIKEILGREMEYSGWLQIILEYDDLPIMRVCVEEGLDADSALAVLVRDCPEVEETERLRTGRVLVQPQGREAFVMSSAGGKVRNVVDKRHA